MLLRFYIVML